MATPCRPARHNAQEKSKLVNQQQAERQKLNRIAADSRALERPEEGGRPAARDPEANKRTQRKELDAAIRKAIEGKLKPKTSWCCRRHRPASWTLPLTPEAKELNADFEKNKGKLPWPVEKGVITSRFGKQPHPVLPGIVIENNGIDITTEKGCDRAGPVPWRSEQRDRDTRCGQGRDPEPRCLPHRVQQPARSERGQRTEGGNQSKPSAPC